jgi:hypothetical protein
MQQQYVTAQASKPRVERFCIQLQHDSWYIWSLRPTPLTTLSMNESKATYAGSIPHILYSAAAAPGTRYDKAGVLTVTQGLRSHSRADEICTAKLHAMLPHRGATGLRIACCRAC